MLAVFRYALQAAVIYCDVKTIGRRFHSPPDFVSFTYDECGQTSNGTIKVHNTRPERPQYTHVVCIHGALRNYSHHQRFVEHVEVNRMFGADHYVLYNHTGSQALLPYIDYYMAQGYMEVHAWHYPRSLLQGHYYGQIALINDCVYRFMYRTQYLALIDLDEFIVPRSHDSWDEMLNASGCDLTAAMVFRQVAFKMERDHYKGQLTSQNSSPVTSRRSRREVQPLPCLERSKMILQPQHTHLANIHSLFKSSEYCCVAPQVGLLHHYRDEATRSTARLITDHSMQRYNAAITSAVRGVVNRVHQQHPLKQQTNLKSPNI